MEKLYTSLDVLVLTSLEPNVAKDSGLLSDHSPPIFNHSPPILSINFFDSYDSATPSHARIMRIFKVVCDLLLQSIATFAHSNSRTVHRP